MEHSSTEAQPGIPARTGATSSQLLFQLSLPPPAPTSRESTAQGAWRHFLQLCFLIPAGDFHPEHFSSAQVSGSVKGHTIPSLCSGPGVKSSAFLASFSKKRGVWISSSSQNGSSYTKQEANSNSSGLVKVRVKPALGVGKGRMYQYPIRY